MVHEQFFLGCALDTGRDAVTVEWTEDKRLEHEQIERALQQLDAFRVGHSGRDSTRTPGDNLLGGDAGRCGAVRHHPGLRD